MKECENVRANGELTSDLVQEYLLYLKHKKNRSSLTLDSYENDLSQFISFVSKTMNNFTDGDDARILCVDEPLARRYADFLQSHYTVSTLSRKIAAMRGFYRYLTVKKKIIANPFAALSAKPSESTHIEYLEQAHLERLFDAISGSDWLAARDRAIVAVLYRTGMRVSELLGLAVNDIDLDRAVVRVRIAGRAARVCALPEWVVHTVERYLERRCGRFSEDSPGQGALFINCDGNGLTTRSIRRKLVHYSRRANLPVETTPAVLRHSCAIHLLRNGADIRAVREQLGHLSGSSMRPYLTCIEQEQKRPRPEFEPLEVAAH